MSLILLLMFGFLLKESIATKPPGYVEKPKVHDPNPPNYDYGYKILDHSGNNQGHNEQRKGEHTKGHYFVNLPEKSAMQEVQYIADDWGFHPLVTYSSKTPHSSSSTRLALGEHAVKELESKGTTPLVPLPSGTVLPAGTSNGFIHHSSQNGAQTHHPLPAPQNALPSTLAIQQPTPTPIQYHQSTVQHPQPTHDSQNPFPTAPDTSPVLQELPKQLFTPEINNQQPYSSINDNSRSSGDFEQAGKQLKNVDLNSNFAEIGISSPDVGVNFPSAVDNGNFVQQKQQQSQNNGESFEDDGQYHLPQPETLVSEQINAGVTGFDSESALRLQAEEGDFGSKITALKSAGQLANDLLKSGAKEIQQLPRRDFYRVYSTTQKTVSLAPVVTQDDGFSKLVASTQNLVSNQDLLNINGAAESNEGGIVAQEGHSVVDSSVSSGKQENFVHINGILNGYKNSVVHVQPLKNSYTLAGSYGKVVNTNFRRPIGAGIISIENDEQVNNAFNTPIVVADFDAGLDKNSISSTTQSSVGTSSIGSQYSEGHDSSLYSTTQSTVETGVTSGVNYLTSQSAAQSGTTIVVTPRPVSQKFLAPLNAGLRLVNSNNVDFLDCPPEKAAHNTDIKEVEDDVIDQENVEHMNRIKTTVELFRSVPLDINAQTQNLANQAIDQAKQLEQSLPQSLLPNQNALFSHQNQYVNALESSKKIQENLNQQLYQLGAQQVLIHPTAQQSQHAAEELSQEIEEHHEENIRQESNQQFRVQNEQSSQDEESQAKNEERTQKIEGSEQNEAVLVQNVQQETAQDAHQYSDDVSTHIDLLHSPPSGNEEAGHNLVANSYSVSVEHPIVPEKHTPTVNINDLIPNEEAVRVEGQNNIEQSNVQVDNGYYQVPQQVEVSYQVNKHESYPNYREPLVVQYQANRDESYAGNGEEVSHQEVPQQQYDDRKESFPIEIQTKIAVPYPVEKQVPYPVEVEKIVEKPVEVTKYINHPYPVEVRVPQPYPVHVHHSYPVERIVEKKVPYPVTVERIVEKPVGVPVQINVPYPVDRIVEKIVEKPYQVTRYVDKPYPVETRVPYPVEVEKIIEKKVPYPVEVKVPYKVEVPHAVPYPVEKIIERPIHVPVHIKVPYPVEKIVDRPYAVAYPVRVNVPYPSHNLYMYGGRNEYAGNGFVLNYAGNQYNNPYNYQSLQSYNRYPSVADSYYRKAPSSYGDIKQQSSYITPSESANIGHVVRNFDGYIGPAPLKASSNVWGVLVNGDSSNSLHYKYRRSDRAGKDLRIEYGGFKPPLIPSLEIDLDGKPVKRSTV